jgi:hypothetical protein
MEKQVHESEGPQVRKYEWMKWLSVEICQVDMGEVEV